MLSLVTACARSEFFTSSPASTSPTRGADQHRCIRIPYYRHFRSIVPRPRDLVIRLGIVLLVLAAAHGLTRAIVVWMRDWRREEQVEEEIAQIAPGAFRGR